jgi:hypothetical protein
MSIPTDNVAMAQGLQSDFSKIGEAKNDGIKFVVAFRKPINKPSKEATLFDQSVSPKKSRRNPTRTVKSAPGHRGKQK